jgi:hypothetical protein
MQIVETHKGYNIYLGSPDPTGKGDACVKVQTEDLALPRIDGSFEGPTLNKAIAHAKQRIDSALDG